MKTIIILVIVIAIVYFGFVYKSKTTNNTWWNRISVKATPITAIVKA